GSGAGPYDLGEEIVTETSVFVFVDGAFMAPNTDYTFSGSEITFTSITPGPSNLIQGYVLATRPIGVANALSPNLYAALAKVVSSRDEMKSLPTTSHRIALLFEGKRSGMFRWDSSIPVATHQADFQEGVYVPPSPSNNGSWVRVFDGDLNPEWWGAVGDNSTDCTAAFESMFAYIKTLGPADYGAARINVPAGRFKIGPITTDVEGFTLFGAGSLSTRFTARDAAQTHVFHFTNTSACIFMQEFEITGWTTTVERSTF